VIRSYATTDTVELHASLQKKVKRRAKKYVELLEGMPVNKNTKSNMYLMK